MPTGDTNVCRYHSDTFVTSSELIYIIFSVAMVENKGNQDSYIKSGLLLVFLNKVLYGTQPHPIVYKGHLQLSYCSGRVVAQRPADA